MYLLLKGKKLQMYAQLAIIARRNHNSCFQKMNTKIKIWDNEYYKYKLLQLVYDLFSQIFVNKDLIIPYF